MPEILREGGFGLYVHWPFCEAKCPYCDFNSHAGQSWDSDAWATAYETEIARLGALTGPRLLRSVYFGGGTPSLMDPAVVERILSAARAAWGFENAIEITLEANPSSVEAARFAGYRAAGVNRVSLGVQALNDPDLRALGRLHDLAQARAALDVARQCFDRVSFDLIYARQNQSLDQWQAELTEALSWGPDHLSLYQLTIEDGTAFARRHRAGGLLGLPDEDCAADMYEMTQDLCISAGLPAYEVSNHARTGQESQHNLIYWTGGDYAAVGPGAHGRLTLNGTRHATEALCAPTPWLEAVTDNSATQWQTLDPQDQAVEYLLMGLRLNQGIALERLASLGAELAPTAPLEELGLVTRDTERLMVTPKGRPVLNEILRQLLV